MSARARACPDSPIIRPPGTHVAACRRRVGGRPSRGPSKAFSASSERTHRDSRAQQRARSVRTRGQFRRCSHHVRYRLSSVVGRVELLHELAARPDGGTTTVPRHESPRMRPQPVVSTGSTTVGAILTIDGSRPSLPASARTAPSVPRVTTARSISASARCAAGREALGHPASGANRGEHGDDEDETEDRTRVGPL